MLIKIAKHRQLINHRPFSLFSPFLVPSSQSPPRHPLSHHRATPFHHCSPYRVALSTTAPARPLLFPLTLAHTATPLHHWRFSTTEECPPRALGIWIQRHGAFSAPPPPPYGWIWWWQPTRMPTPASQLQDPVAPSFSSPWPDLSMLSPSVA